jgi:hypothetical protein
VLIGNDLETMNRLLGLAAGQEVPAKYVREYEIRKHLYDMDGDCGAMGTIAIIDLLRHCNYAPPPKIEVEKESDWRGTKRGCRVQCIVNNEWQSGDFLGFGDLGSLHIQLDHEDWVREFPRRMVRISADQTKPKIQKVVAKEEPLVPLQLKPEEIPGIYRDEYMGFTPGDNVWADLRAAGLGDDIAEAKFVRCEGLNIVVNLAGHEFLVPSQFVTSGSPAAA